MRPILVLLMVLSTLPVGAAPAAADPPSEFTFEGAGWGHGVGLSQYGAKGQSLVDPSKPGAEIAMHYFPGSAVESLSDLDLSVDYLDTIENPLWINLDTNRTRLTFQAVGGPLDLCLSGDGEGPCPKPEQPQDGETWTFETLPGEGCAFFKGGVQQGTAGDCQAAIAWPDAAGVDVDDVCGAGDVYDCRYQYGEIKIRPAEDAFHVSLAVGLEEYLRGLGELPIDWAEPGANEAQAIAARSYAVHEFLHFEEIYPRTGLNAGVPTNCYCHMYDDGRDQAYVGSQINGLDRENLGTHWTAGVEATAGQVLTYRGADAGRFTNSGVIKAFFHSSSGGWTESNVSGFGSSTLYPFLDSVRDPWALDPATGNPNADWAKTISATQIAAMLGVDQVTSARMISAIPHAQVEFGVVDNGVAGIRVRGGGWLRTDLGLLGPGLRAIDGVGAGPPSPFDDIAGSVHFDAIVALFDAGITQGCDEDSFCPRRPVTRGQMASFIARAMQLPAASADHFADDGGSTHQENINRLFEVGITNGCATDRFCPEDPVSRGQMAVFLIRALNLTESDADVFGDDDATPYEGAINAIAEAGITAGCTSTNYCPFSAVERAQMAAFLSRAFPGEN